MVGVNVGWRWKWEEWLFEKVVKIQVDMMAHVARMEGLGRTLLAGALPVHVDNCLVRT